ncbi:MAG: hypothetical protein LCH91_27025 [Bacteroidetes bacterium]|nr:hypothetical protein [Bacteroidota bacterium]
MSKLVNGKPTRKKITDIKSLYDEMSTKKKREIREQIAESLGITPRNAYRRIVYQEFSPNDLNTIWEDTGICFCAKRGFFLDTDVSKMETLEKYGLTI